MAKETQTQKILSYMRQFGSITPLDAVRDLGVMRLAARISDLRKEGYDIVSEQHAVKNRFGETCYVAKYSERREGI
jgi:hypothetical protein